MTLPLKELREALEKMTRGPWHPCAHLRKSLCGCSGNRAFIYGNGEADDGLILEMFHQEDRPEDVEGSFHDGQELPSRTRMLANAALIGTAINNLEALLDAVEERDELKACLLSVQEIIAGRVKERAGTHYEGCVTAHVDCLIVAKIEDALAPQPSPKEE